MWDQVSPHSHSPPLLPPSHKAPPSPTHTHKHTPCLLVLPIYIHSSTLPSSTHHSPLIHSSTLPSSTYPLALSYPLSSIPSLPLNHQHMHSPPTQFPTHLHSHSLSHTSTSHSLPSRPLSHSLSMMFHSQPILYPHLPLPIPLLLPIDAYCLLPHNVSFFSSLPCPASIRVVPVQRHPPLLSFLHFKLKNDAWFSHNSFNCIPSTPSHASLRQHHTSPFF